MTNDIDLTSSSAIADPYPAFRTLRDAEPVSWSPQLNGWMVTRYEDVVAGFRDSRLSANRITPLSGRRSPEHAARMEPFIRYMSRWAAMTDAPVHTRLRKVMNAWLNPRAFRDMRGAIESIVDRQIEVVRASPEPDFIRDFAGPLPALVIAAMMGVPDDDMDNLQLWSKDVGTSASRVQKTKMDVASDGITRMADYFREFIAQRRRSPQSFVTDGLINAADNDALLDPDELVATLILILFAGHETTTHLLSNGLKGLIEHPLEMARFRAQADDADFLKTAILEMLRFDGPALASIRVATTTFEWHGQTIDAGDFVYLFNASANRDERRFADPDRFDLTRKDAIHNVTFGYGIHHCIGSSLAKLEAEIAFPKLLAAFGEIELTTEPLDWSDSLIQRGTTRLPVHVS